MPMDTLATIFHLEYIDPDRNMYRYYHLYLAPNLFKEWSLLQDWGRIGQRQKHSFRQIKIFSQYQQAKRLLDTIIHNKKKRGYTPITV
ncbi:MAG: WGR domain-containing protein [Zymomonas mobilis subsp. pomaceae]|uniref:WGR domain-containing protein n=1 Tax=Zymomonas mobilis TaxID=542 RepID=UPI0039ED2FB5